MVELELNKLFDDSTLHVLIRFQPRKNAINHKYLKASFPTADRGRMKVLAMQGAAAFAATSLVEPAQLDLTALT